MASLSLKVNSDDMETVWDKKLVVLKAFSEL